MFIALQKVSDLKPVKKLLLLLSLFFIVACSPDSQDSGKDSPDSQDPGKEKKIEIKLTKYSEAYLVNSKNTEIPLWNFPGARNESKNQGKPLITLTDIGSQKVNILNIESLENSRKLPSCVISYATPETCLFNNSSRYHRIQFENDGMKYEGWVARIYLYKDPSGLVNYSADSNGNFVNLELPRYSISPILAFDGTDIHYCSVFDAAVLLDASYDTFPPRDGKPASGEQGEFETKDEFNQRIRSLRSLAYSSNWLERVYVKSTFVSTNGMKYDISNQVLEIKVDELDGRIFSKSYGIYKELVGYYIHMPSIYSSACPNVPYGFDYDDFSVTIPKESKYKPFEIKPIKKYSYSSEEDGGVFYRFNIDRDKAKYLKTSGVSMRLYYGIKFKKWTDEDHGYSRDFEGNEHVGAYSSRSFPGEVMYMFLINPHDNSLLASYFSKEYLDEYLNNDVDILLIKRNMSLDTNKDIKLLSKLIDLEYQEQKDRR